MESIKQKQNNKWLPAGTILDQRYRITDVLGDGGFGITYAAVHRNMKKSVAIKEFFCRDYMIRDARVSPDIRLIDPADEPKYTHALEKFLHEAQILSSVSDVRGVVHVTDYFQENKTAYIVMDLVEGVSLSSRLQKGTRYSWDDLIRKMLPLIESLSLEHKKDLIHRDIKPENILVSEDGNFTLIDFGSAIRYKGEETHSVYLSEGYAPKEQYLRNGRLGPFTDIYSLCAVMYHCLTGQVPEHSVQRAVFDELRKPSDAGIQIPAELENILMKGLSIEPEARWQDMSELYEALSSLLSKPKKPRKLLFVFLGIASTLSVLALIYTILNYSSIRIRQEIKNEETLTFDLRAPDTMSAKDFDAAIRILELRMDTLVGKHHYLEEKMPSAVSLKIPRKYFPKSPDSTDNDILNKCLAFDGNWLLHNPEKTRYYVMSSKNVESVRLEFGHLPIITSAGEDDDYLSNDPIDWSQEEETYYLEITLDDETSSFLRDFLSEPGYQFKAVARIEQGETSYLCSWYAEGDGRTLYYPVAQRDCKSVAETYKMLFDSEGYSETLLLAYIHKPTQLMKDEAPVIEIIQDVDNARQMSACADRSRTLLELLEIPYELEKNYDSISLRIPAKKTNLLICESLLHPSCSITTVWDETVFSGPEIARAEVVEAEDGLDLDVYLSSHSTGHPLADLTDSDGNAISSDGFYLYINRIRTGTSKSIDPENDRITFHLLLSETEPDTISNQKMAAYIANILSLHDASYEGRLSSDTWYDENGKEILKKDIPEYTTGTDMDRFSSLYREVEDLGGTMTHSLVYYETLNITFNKWSGDFPVGALQMIESLYTNHDMDKNICSVIDIKIESWYHGESVSINAVFSVEPESKSVICSSGSVSCTDTAVLDEAKKYIESSPILYDDESRFTDGKKSILNEDTSYWRYTGTY